MIDQAVPVTVATLLHHPSVCICLTSPRDSSHCAANAGNLEPHAQEGRGMALALERNAARKQRTYVAGACRSALGRDAKCNRASDFMFRSTF